MSCDISVIIPQCGRSELTQRCLESLFKFHSRLQVIVVDDGSPDNSLRDLQRNEFASVEIVRCQKNQGITAAWNLGFQHAHGSFLIFLNNDVVTNGPWCDRLIAPLQNAALRMGGVRFRRERDLPPVLMPETQLLEGWCFAVSCSTFAALNGFDERFALYYSDTDFQCRLLIETQDSSDLQCIENLPIKHLKHQTTSHYSHRGLQWRADREAFLKKWS